MLMRALLAIAAALLVPGLAAALPTDTAPVPGVAHVMSAEPLAEKANAELPPSPGAVDPKLPLARQAVREMLGGERLLQLFGTMAAERDSSRFSNSPSLKKLEQRYPGITIRVARAGSALVLDHMKSELDAAVDSGAIQIAAECSTDELKTLADFYRGPVGSRWFDLVFVSISANWASRSPVPGQTAKGIATAAQKMSATEQAEFERFQRSPLGSKMQKISPRILAVAMNALRQPPSVSEEEIEAVTEATINSYISQGPGV